MDYKIVLLLVWIAYTIIVFSYKFWIISQILASKFLTKYDNKEKLLKEEIEKLKDIKSRKVEPLFYSLPFLLSYILLYLILLNFPNLIIDFQLEQLRLSYYILPIISELIFIWYMLYWLNDKDFDVDNQWNLQFTFPLLLFFIIIIAFIFWLLIDKLPWDIIIKILWYLNINSISDNNFSLWLMLYLFIFHMVMKFISKILTGIDINKYKYILYKEWKKTKHRILSIPAFVYTLVILLWIIYIFFTNINILYSIKIWDIVILFTFFIIWSLLLVNVNLILNCVKNILKNILNYIM